jgi:tol-pal system protein YbgF
MTMPAPARFLTLAALVFVLADVAGPASASGAASFTRPPASAAGPRVDDPIVLAQIFRRRDDAPVPPGNMPEQTQAPPDLVVRLDRLENQIRQLTGLVEQLQFRNQQLEQQLQRMQQDVEFRFQEMGSSGRPPAGRGQSGALPGPGPRPGPAAGPAVATGPGIGPGPATAPSAGRRDVFDPTTAPNAPGAPRTLGTLPGGPDPGPVIMAPGSGEPVRRPPGSPLDLGSLSGVPTDDRIIPPPGVSPDVARPGERPVGPQAVLAPSGDAKDEYDLAYGYILRRDYDLADQGFRTFLTNHPRDRLVPEANYWLGESQFQRKLYNDSAEVFLDLYNKYPNSLKAPDALLRLGQSLAALGKQDAACASLGAVLTKYPKASANLKRAVEQEQKRARC